MAGRVWPVGRGAGEGPGRSVDHVICGVLRKARKGRRGVQRTTGQPEGMTRARFLAAAAVGAVGVTGATGALRPAAASSAAAARGLRYRGVCYDVSAGELPATRWDPVRMRADMRAVKDRLHYDPQKMMQRLTGFTRRRRGGPSGDG